jgi:hypothetical protein
MRKRAQENAAAPQNASDFGEQLTPVERVKEKRPNECKPTWPEGQLVRVGVDTPQGAFSWG